ncbi:MAG: YciI family protein [Marmoricola sp.]
MPQYLIVFNAEWVPELTDDDILEASRTSSALVAEMTAAGVWVFGAGLDDDSLVGGIDLVNGKPVVLDGPYAETKEHLGGFSVVDVPDDATARYWAGRLAVACGWPQQVHRVMTAPHLREEPEAG